MYSIGSSNIYMHMYVHINPANDDFIVYNHICDLRHEL